MAAALGLSPASIHRIWEAHGLQPHRVRTFKLSTDPAFVEKLTDVVGLYVNPPDKALVFRVDDGRRQSAAPRGRAHRAPSIARPRAATGSSRRTDD